LADDENRAGLMNENDLGKKSALLDTRNVQLLVVARQRDFMCEFRSGYLGGQTHKLRKGAECGKNNPWKRWSMTRLNISSAIIVTIAIRSPEKSIKNQIFNRITASSKVLKRGSKRSIIFYNRNRQEFVC
jgi:hypothetical protein